MRRRTLLQLPEALWMIGGLLWLGCADPQSQPTAGDPVAAAATPEARPSPQNPWFQDVAQQVGLDFRHQDGRSGRRYYVETVASGGGWLDYDGDGDLDLYLVNGAATPGSDLPTEPRNALYENRQGRFVEVAAAAGLDDTGYGMGFCVGDYDADGRLDIFVTNYGVDRLFHNLGEVAGQVRFEEVAERAGVAGRRWGTGCAFADLDLDGDQDLYVANYVDFDYDNNPRCGDVTRDVWSYCRPAVFNGQRDQLYINRGDGTFYEEAELRGIAPGADERGFGVIASDMNDDGAPDLLVANDGTLNRFYVNDGKGYFTDQALASGLSSNRSGHAESGMGLALGDADGDGLQDLMVTNYSFETNTLYNNRGDLFFEDQTEEAGLGAPSYLRVGWGVVFFDADNDGDLDVAVANGHVMDTIDEFEHGIGYPQRNLLFANDGKGRFRDVSDEAGAAFAVAKVSRALALGDWNDDGRLDLLVTNTNDTADLLENRLETGHHWIGLKLEGDGRNPTALGARAVLDCGGERIGVREVMSGGSLLAQHDLRLHFGLGSCDGPAVVQVLWPDGHRQDETFETVDAYIILRYAGP